MPSAILSKVLPQHRQKLMTPLAAEANAALKQMGANRLLRPVTSPETNAQLIEAGYARETLGGIALTDIGQVRAAMENGQ